VSRAFHALVAALLDAEFDLSDCIEDGSRALLIFGDVNELRRLVLLLGDSEPSSRFGARLMMGSNGELPVCIGLNLAEMRRLRREVAAYNAERDRALGGVERDDPDADAEPRRRAVYPGIDVTPASIRAGRPSPGRRS
jgi:hypothetical protein